MSLSRISPFFKLGFTVRALIVDSQRKFVRDYLSVPRKLKISDMMSKTFKISARLLKSLKEFLRTPRFPTSPNSEDSLYSFLCNFFDQSASGFIQKLNSGTVRRIIIRLKDLAQLILNNPTLQQFKRKELKQNFNHPNVINFTLKVLDLLFLSEDCTDMCKVFGYGCCRDCASLDNGREAYIASHTDYRNCIEQWKMYYQHLNNSFLQLANSVVYEEALQERLMYEPQENTGAMAVSGEFDINGFHSLMKSRM